MPKKQFKAESKRLLELMINSIYTHREIFLRELISNASDALDKLYYSRSLSDGNTGISREDLVIRLEINKEARTLTVRDNGIGMTRDELENNLGTIARSGSLQFKKENEDAADMDIIGQFGVGFYSAFMVSDLVTVESKAYGSDEAWRWQSKGTDGYILEPCEKAEVGTDIVLHIKPKTEEEDFDEFLQPYRIRELIKKYSDYIRYPIQMDMEKSRMKEGTEEKPEYESYTENETLNSMVPLWKKNKSEVTEEEFDQLYQGMFFDYEKPLRVIRTSGEGAVTYDAVLFIPARAPHNYYTREYEKGLRLYASGVMIMERCGDLLPDHFGFVRGIVDSEDLSLNISREMLQQDRQLKLIASRLEKKIKSELLSLLTSDRTAYEKFFTQFGVPLKAGICADYGQHKELLQDLLLYRYSGNDSDDYTGAVTLAEYAEQMKEGQKYIYYASGESLPQLRRLPQTEAVLDKGYAILYMTDEVDEFAVRAMGDFSGKEFRSVSGGDLGFEEEDAEKEDSAADQPLFDYMKEALDGKVKEVRASRRLKSYPVCLTADGEISLEMEKMFNAMPGGMPPIHAERVLEVSRSHPVFPVLAGLLETDKEKLAMYTQMLYTGALLIEGLPADDPAAFSNQICGLMK